MRLMYAAHGLIVVCLLGLAAPRVGSLGIRLFVFYLNKLTFEHLYPRGETHVYISVKRAYGPGSKARDVPLKFS